MKLILTLSSLAALLAMSVSAAEPPADAKKAVAAAQEKWKAAVIAGDGATLGKLLADDLSYTHSSAKTQTKTEFIQDVTKGTTTYKSIDFTDDVARQYGTTVIVTRKATITTVQTGSSHLFITEVWVRQGGGWVMANRQATKLP